MDVLKFPSSTAVRLLFCSRSDFAIGEELRELPVRLTTWTC